MNRIIELLETLVSELKAQNITNATLTERVAVLEQREQPKTISAIIEGCEALSDRVTKLEDRQAPDVSELDDRVSDLESKFSNLEDDVSSLDSKVEDIPDVTDLENRVSDLEDKPDASDLESRVEDLEGNADGIVDITSRLTAVESKFIDTSTLERIAMATLEAIRGRVEAIE